MQMRNCRVDEPGSNSPLALAKCRRDGSLVPKARLIEQQQDRYEHLATQTEKLSSLGRLAAGIAAPSAPW